MTALSRLAALAIDDRSVEAKLARMTETLREQFDWDFIACATVHWPRRVSVCRAVSSKPGHKTNISVGLEVPLEQGEVGKAALGGEQIFRRGRWSGKHILPFPKSSCALSIPLFHQQEVIAVLDVESCHVDEIEPHRNFLSASGDIFASAIIHGRRIAEQRKQAGLMRMMSRISKAAMEADNVSQSLRRIVEVAVDNLPVSAASILMLDETGQYFNAEIAAGTVELDMPFQKWPISVGACGRCARTGEPQLVHDPSNDPDYIAGHPDVKSEYMVPIIRDGVLGVLNLESTEVDAFSKEVRHLALSMAAQIAGAIYLARQAEALERTNAELRRANLKLQRQTSMDGLTGVANRRRFDTCLDNEWRRSTRHNHPLSILLIDVDCFKPLNDHYGHQYGDECLKRIAAALAGCAQREGELLARYGGEEFAAIIPHAEPGEAERLGEQMREAIEALNLPNKSSIASDRVTVSIGLATRASGSAISAKRLLQQADNALYRAKRGGRNRLHLAEQIKVSVVNAD
ncbi:MAG: hypothetical protein DHS20C11_22820 [Lysobacteraceae bacterium]|nr:MAG: hypothetical protein DHS20C11_22820 [Xanthomonadaceae bacterium]